MRAQVGLLRCGRHMKGMHDLHVAASMAVNMPSYIAN
jgi:hypothetical protein